MDTEIHAHPGVAGAGRADERRDGYDPADH